MPRALTGELDLQCRVIAHLRAAGVLCCHVPNEGRVTQRVANLRRAQGVLAGVPDILIFDRPPRLPSYVGCALELKIEGGRVSAEQKVMIDELRRRGWLADVTFGLEPTLAVLRAFGYL